MVVEDQKYEKSAVG